MTPSKFEQDFCIPTYCFDINSRMRPAAFFEIAQDLAVNGATMVGAPDPVLRQKGVVWILIRMHVHFDSLPRLYEPVKLQTWHAGVAGPLYLRDYVILSADGKPLVRATSSWGLMDIENRTLARADRIFDVLDPAPQHPDRALEANAPKIVWPAGALPDMVTTHRVMYSDVDYNGHANNARYPVWAYDILPAELAASGRITDFSINYNRELHPGEEAEIRRMPAGGSAWLVEGSHDGLQSFICKISFTQ